MTQYPEWRGWPSKISPDYEPMRSRLPASEYSSSQWLSGSSVKPTDRTSCHAAICPQLFAERRPATKWSDRPFSKPTERSSAALRLRSLNLLLGLVLFSLGHGSSLATRLVGGPNAAEIRSSRSTLRGYLPPCDTCARCGENCAH